VARHLACGDQCLTVHAGWGIEDYAEVFRLVEFILVEESDRYAKAILYRDLAREYFETARSGTDRFLDA
jgi:hypothetical protein